MESEQLTEFRVISITPEFPITSSVFPGNKLQISRYTWLTIVPQCLFEEFRRFSNIWFVVVSLFQLIPNNLNATDSWTTIIPLLMLLLTSLIKDIVIDYKLRSKINEYNSVIYSVWDGSQFISMKAENLMVGHIVKLNEGDVVPTDMILVARILSGRIFLDMSRLLGSETIKEKKPLDALSRIFYGAETDDQGILRLNGKFKVTEPCANYTSCIGTYKPNNSPIAFDINSGNLLFSGGILKGEGPVIGFVIYCGNETKMRLNTTNIRKKSSSIEDTINFWVLCMLGILVILVGGSLVGYHSSYNQKLHKESVIDSIISFALLYSSIVPISLFMILDVIRTIQSWIFAARNPNVTFNTENLNDTLGQIDVLVANINGSISKQSLEVKALVLENEIFEADINEEKAFIEVEDGERFMDNSKKSPSGYRNLSDLKSYINDKISSIQVEMFVTCMIFCNSLYQHKEEFLGSQEDKAILETVKALGFTPSLVNNTFEIESTHYLPSYRHIHYRPYSSDSKRIRVLLEDTNDRHGVLLVKGNFKIMSELMNITTAHASEILMNVSVLKSKGYKCKVLAYRKIPKVELKECKSRLHMLRNILMNNDGKIENIFRNLESNLRYLGIVALEHPLLPGATETIDKIKNAGIKIWLTTNDTCSDAKRAAFNSGTIDLDSNVVKLKRLRSEGTCTKTLMKALNNFVFDQVSKGLVLEPSRSSLNMRKANKQLSENRGMGSSIRDEESKDEEDYDVNPFNRYRPNMALNPLFKQVTRVDMNTEKAISKPFNPAGVNYSVIIDKETFNLAIHDEECRRLLVCVLMCAKSVVFSNMLPKDKGNIIKLLKENVKFKPIVAAVGFGESDIIMLSQAHCGICISDNQDLVTLCFSDIVIKHFSQLHELILIFGHHNYTRIFKSILLFFYKNCFLTIITLSYLLFANFDSASIFNTSMVIGYNIFFTTLPIIIMGILDEDFDYVEILKDPEIYQKGIACANSSWKGFVSYIVMGISHGVILALLCCFCLPGIISIDGMTENFTLLSTFMFITIVIVVLIEIYSENQCYTLPFYGSILLSITFLVIFLSIQSNTSFTTSEQQGAGEMLIKSPFSFFSITFTALACIIPSYLVFTFYRISSLHSSVFQEIKFNRLNPYSNSLASIYKTSSNWKNAIRDQKFSINMLTLHYKFLYVQNKYLQSFFKEHTVLFKFTTINICVLLLFWLAYFIAVEKFSATYIYAGILFVVLCKLFLLLLWTVHFFKNYSLYIIFASFFGLISIFVLEMYACESYIMSAVLVSALSCLVFNINWLFICIFNMLNILLFIIAASVQYTEVSNYIEATLNTIRSIILLLVISFISATKSYYRELSRRTDFKNSYQSKIGIEKTQSILSILFPPFVRSRVKQGLNYMSDTQNEVSVLFCDICNFDYICRKYNPYELTSFLDSIYRKFDTLCEEFGVTKIETVGKTYMACAGLKDNDKDLPRYLSSERHARRAVELALAMIQEVKLIPLKNGDYLQVKIGINSGPVIAGVVGLHKPQFSLVGDTVNTASRMCSTIENYNEIQISFATHLMINDYSEYECLPKTVFAKGKGNVKVFVVSEARSKSIENNDGLGNTIGTTRSSFGSPGIGLERSLVQNSEMVKGPRLRPSKLWKKNLMNKKEPGKIRDTPKFFTSIFFSKDKNELDFLSKRKKIDHKPTLFNLFSMSIFSICILIITILENTLTSVYLNSSQLVGNILLLMLHIPLTLSYKNNWSTFPYFLLASLTLMLIISLLKLPYSSLPADLISLDFFYLTVILFTTVQLYLGASLLSFCLILAFWIIVSALTGNILLQLPGIVITISFGLINLMSIYIQEKHQRAAFNLRYLAKKEIKENEDLLVQLMPPHVLENLEKDKVYTDRLKNVTLIYADIVGFTDWSSTKPPSEVVEMLSNLFTRFDRLCVDFDVYKVHTIGDCYVVMGNTGKRERDVSMECLNMIKMTYKMIEVIKEENIKHNSNLNMRIGVHTGEVIAGVIGTSIVRYDIWGPDVLIANKMESNGRPGSVKVSNDTKIMIESRVDSGILFEESEVIDISAIGVKVSTYYVSCDDINSIKLLE